MPPDPPDPAWSPEDGESGSPGPGGTTRPLLEFEHPPERIGPYRILEKIAADRREHGDDRVFQLDATQPVGTTP